MPEPEKLMPKTQYEPTQVERVALNKIDKAFKASKDYYHKKHERMKRLYAKYFNESVKEPRPLGYSDERLGMVYRVAEVLYSQLSESLLGNIPFGGLEAEGDEDFWGKQIIDRVHGWQQNKAYIYNAIDSAIWYSVITGTGMIMPGWEHWIKRYFKDQPEIVSVVNPNDPIGEPLQLQTGKTKEVEVERVISRLEAKVIAPWNVFPTAGAVADPQKAHEIIFRVPMTREELLALQRIGYIDNVEAIPDEAYGVIESDIYLDQSDIDKARREDPRPSPEEDQCWILFCFMLFPYFNYKEHVAEGQEQSDDEYECFMIRPQHADVMLKLELNKLAGGAKRCCPFKYAGPNDMFFGISPLEIAEILIQLDEDMFNMTQDRAKREIYKRWAVIEGIDQSQLSPALLEAIVEVPKSIATGHGEPVKVLDAGPTLMPNLQKQREVVYSLIDEITGAIDFVRGMLEKGGEDETATKTAQRARYIGNRFKTRIKYFEKNGLWWWMQWQTVLNVEFLDDRIVSMLTGAPPALNPFRLIEPVIPLESYDFSFVGSSKALDDPVKAQILRGVLDIAGKIPPGQDAQGKWKRPNTTYLFEEFLKRIDVLEDIERAFIEMSPEEVQMMTMTEGNIGGGGTQKLGALNLADLLSNVNAIKGGTKIRQGV